MEMRKFFEEDGQLKEFKVAQDVNPLFPREWDSVCKIYIEWSRREHYGDDFEGKSLEDVIREYGRKYLDDDVDDMTRNEIVIALQTKATEKVKVFPIFGHEHGDFTISMACEGQYADRWDGGFAGYVFCEKETCDKYGAIFSKAREIAKCEVKELDMYLRGEVYGYEIEDGDSCWGFYSEKYGDELFYEIASEAGYGNVKFYDESEIEETVTVTVTRKLKESTKL